MPQLYAIKQIITATNQFDGTLPGTTPADSNGVRTYPTDTAGGLFDPLTEMGATGIPVEIVNVQVKFGGQSSWSLVLSDPDGDVTVQSGTTEASLFYNPDEALVLLPGQTLKLSTTGATTAMYAAVLFATASIGGF